MRQLTCDPNLEIRGDALLSLLQNLRAENVAPYLGQFNLTDIHTDAWYPTRDFLDLLNELDRASGHVLDYVAIGLSLAETAYMPPELEQAPFSEMLEGWDDHYQANHRNADIGHKVTKKISDRHYTITLGSIYPDDMEYGVVYGFAKRFLPPGTPFTVWYDEDIQRLDEGGEQTVIHVRWS